MEHERRAWGVRRGPPWTKVQLRMALATGIVTRAAWGPPSLDCLPLHPEPSAACGPEDEVEGSLARAAVTFQIGPCARVVPAPGLEPGRPLRAKGF